MTLHTVGPWTLEGTTIKHYPDGIIARIPTVSKGGVFVMMANARLIAAAPELLAALKALLRDGGNPFPTLAQATRKGRAAIAKAEGVLS